MVIQSCLFDAALDAGVEERTKFKRAFADHQKEKEVRDLDFQDRIKVASENGEEVEPI